MARRSKPEHLLPDLEVQTARVESLKLVVEAEILVAKLEEHTTDLEMLVRERPWGEDSL